MNIPTTLTLLLAVGLAALIAYELRPTPATILPPGDPAVRPTTPTAPGSIVTNRTTSIDTLLGRPLFSQTRMPSTQASTPAIVAAAAPLPRVTAILIDGLRRSVIFAAPGGGRPLTVAEGGRVGPFTVESIAPQQVVVRGPDGKQTVRASFDPTLPPPTPIATFLPPQFPGITAPGLPSGALPLLTPGGRLPGTGIPQFNPPGSAGLVPGAPGAGLGAAR